MKRSSKLKLAAIFAGGVTLLVLGHLADRLMRAEGGDSIAGNVYLLVLVGTVGLVAAVLRTDRNRDVAHADAGTRAQALALEARPGQARVVVFRNDTMGGRLGADVRVDERLHTQLTSPGFTVIDLAPGAHRIGLEWEGRQAAHALALKAGDVVALHVKMRLALTTTTPTLEPVDAGRARRLIGNAPLALPLAATA